MPRKRPRPAAPLLRKAIEKHKRVVYREAILEAASNVFGRLGFNDARMADIADEAGVSVGTLYNYFESKDAVIGSFIAREHEHFCARIDEVEQFEDPLERIHRLIEVLFRHAEERGMLLSMAARDGLLQRHLAAEQLGADKGQARLCVLQRYGDALAQATAGGLLRSDLAVSRLALMLDGAVSALVFDWVRSDRTQPLHEQTELVFEVFMKGVQAR